MIPPDTTPFETRQADRCTDCDDLLAPDRRWRCERCTAAARRAVMRAGPGAVVRPSDLARERGPGTSD